MATLHCSHHLNLLTNPSDQTLSIFKHKPSPKSINPPRTKTLKFAILCKKPINEDAFKEKKTVSVDYDKGEHEVSVHLSGFRKADLPKHRRVRVQGNRYQKDWAISDVVQRILKLKHWEDIDGVLNHWVGRFARKNFPLLIREITQTGSIEHSNHVFWWMKVQQNYCARNDIYNMMIRLYARHNQTDQARGLVDFRCGSPGFED